jgi:hypothetical protein
LPTLAQARRFYLPSALECSPLMVFETMSMGVPWVSLDVGNVAESPGGIVVWSLREAEVANERILSADEQAGSLAELGRTPSGTAGRSYGRCTASFSRPWGEGSPCDGGSIGGLARVLRFLLPALERQGLEVSIAWDPRRQLPGEDLRD